MTQPDQEKPVEFEGSALEDLRAFPKDARRDMGQQIGYLQEGRQPDAFKPMKTVGSGVFEITLTEREGEFRAIYVAKFADAIYILHCFQKKTQATTTRDIAIARDRYKSLVNKVKQNANSTLLQHLGRD